MPITGSAAWNTATASQAKHAVYIVRFAGLTSVQFATGPVKSASRTSYGYLSDLVGLSQESDPVDGRFSIGSVSFTLLDKNAEITAYLDAELYLNQEITLLAGYADIAEADYEVLNGVTFLTGIETVAGGAAYRITTGDPKRPTIEDLFTNADAGTGRLNASLASGAAAGTATLPVTAVEIEDAESLLLVNTDDRLMVMNAARQEELVEVFGVDKNHQAIYTKTALNYTYAAGDALHWGATYLKGTLIDIYYSLMTGCFALSSSATVATTCDDTASAGSTLVPLASTTGIQTGDGYFLRNAAGTAEEVVIVDSVAAGVSITARSALKNTYASGDAFESTAFPLTDFWGLPTGLGLPTWRMDATGLAAERDDWLRELELEVEVKKRERAQSWMADNLFSIFGWPIVTPDGLVGYHTFAPRRASAAVLTLDEDSISETVWRRRWDIVYNRILLRYDYDPAKDKYRTETVVEDTTAQASSGVKELVVELPGVVTRDDGIVVSYVDMFARRFVARYGTGAVEIAARVHFSKRGAILGEAANLSHPTIPNIRTGTRSLPARTGSAPAPGYDVVKIAQRLTPDPYLQMTVQDNHFTRPGFIGATAVEYSAASAAQRLYAFIAPTAANFTDGTEPYKVI